jgi:hypothetical protein
MSTASLAYQDFVRICHALQRMQQASVGADLWFIRNALVSRYQEDRPALACTLSGLTTAELETLLAHVERHNGASCGRATSHPPLTLVPTLPTAGVARRTGSTLTAVHHPAAPAVRPKKPRARDVINRAEATRAMRDAEVFLSKGLTRARE